MNIYISEDLLYMKEKLINKGYTVIEDNNVQCDAIICDLKNCDLMKLNVQNNLKREGTLVIDCGSKSIEDIDYILSNRVYASSF
jgi:hypothetical protein